MLVAKRLEMQRKNVKGWENVAKQEAKLSEDLQAAYYGKGNYHQEYSGGDFIIPLGSSLMPHEDRIYKSDDGKGNECEVVIPGIPTELRKRCQQMMETGQTTDLDELRWIEKRLGIPLMKADTFNIHKDLSANTATSGGTLVAEAAQGELIGILRAQEAFSRAGARQVDLPPQGSVRYPRVTTSVTVSATVESGTITESTPTTGALQLIAKPYSTLTDIVEELMMFASVSVDGWLRTEMTREAALKIDRDSISGAGGIAIQGAINYSGINSTVASTVAANGNTLGAADLFTAYADVADQNAPVDMGFFYMMTNSVYAGLSTRTASSSGDFAFAQAFNALGGGKPNMQLNGSVIIGTTQIPITRTKGSASNLTLVLCGVGQEWIIGRAGVISIKMTDSDASKFATRISTMRATQYVDAGPRHEASFGVIDTLLNS